MVKSVTIRGKIFFFFLLYFLIDFVLIAIILNIRVSYKPSDLGLGSAFENLDTRLHLIPNKELDFLLFTLIIFILQNIMVFIGFVRVNSKEDKYLLFPEDESGDQQYHYFTPDQLLVFIELTANEITGSEKSYSKIYITREPKPKMFSYFLFGKRTIVLNPTILQIAETHELRASLAIDLDLTKSTFSSLVRIYSSQHGSFFFIAFYGALVPFFREILIILTDTNSLKEKTGLSNPNPLQYLLLFMFLTITIIMIMIFVRKFVSIFIHTANRNLVNKADLETSELVGARAVINTLLKIGQRNEAIEVILDEMQYLEELERGKLIETLEREKLLKLVQKFPIASIDHDAALKMAPEIFIRQKLDALENIYHCNFVDKDKIIQDSVEVLLAERLAVIKKWKETVKEGNPDIELPTSVDLQIMLDDCIKFDDTGIDIRSQLKDDEIQIMVEKIKEKPRKKLFVHEPISAPLWNSFPTIADRIILVNKMEFRG